MQIRFDNKRVVIGAAARGFGYHLARQFADLGAEVHGCDIALEELQRIADFGAVPKALDLRDRGATTAWITDIQRDGPIDVLVNCCGGPAGFVKQPIEDVVDSQWDLLMDINAGAAFALCRAVATGMKRAGRGRIVNVSSAAGLRSSPTGIVAYVAAKHAVIGLTRQLAIELSPFGINVNSVAPGFVRTTEETERHWDSFGEAGQALMVSEIATRRLGTVDDISSAVLFFASDLSSWITGQVLVVDGGR